MAGSITKRPFYLGLAAASLAAGYFVARRARMDDLAGEVVLITGGSRGLGFLLAREFAAQGCRIVICARDGDELQRAREALEREGAAAVFAMTCDVSDVDQVRRLVREATDHFGRIDILVNNAGIIQAGAFSAMERRDFERAMDVMFWGPFNCTMAVLPQMRDRQQGRIVNITSIGALVSVPHLLPYNCAKFAAEGLSEGLNAELAKENIHVTTIAPGLIRNGSYMNAIFKGDPEKEFAWFAPSASLPFLSMKAERVARQIVSAVRRREAMRVLTIPAMALSRIHGLMPGTTGTVLGVVNRFLPASESHREARGYEVQARSNSRTLGALTRLGQSKAQALNEV